MAKIATFKTKYLKDDHLFIPKEVASTLLLRRGDEVRVMIEKKNLTSRVFLTFLVSGKTKVKKKLIYRML